MIDMTHNFFDSHPDFYEGDYANQPEAMSLRFKAIIGDNVEIIRGARIVDLGFFDGRWGFAALKNGAQFVRGYDARKENLDRAKHLFEKYGMKNYEFVQLNLDTHPEGIVGHYDVAFVLGLIYHTANHLSLLSHIVDTGVKHIIVDSNVIRSNKPTVLLKWENTSKLACGFSEVATVPVAVPSVGSLKLLLSYFGFNQLRFFDWSNIPKSNIRSLAKYRKGERVTFVASK